MLLNTAPSAVVKALFRTSRAALIAFCTAITPNPSTVNNTALTKELRKSESSRIRILFELGRMNLRKALKGCKLPLELWPGHLLGRTLHLLLQKDMGVDGLRVNLCFKTTTVYSLRLKKSTLNLMLRYQMGSSVLCSNI